MGSWEFLMWAEHFRQEFCSVQRQDYYFALLASEIRSGNVKNPASVNMNDFILKFGGGSSQKQEPLTADQRKARIAASKAAWCGAVGVKIPK